MAAGNQDFAQSPMLGKTHTYGSPTITYATTGTQAIHKKLHKIMSEIQRLAKDKRNDHFKYDYLSEAAIKAAVQPKLVEHGVLFRIDINKVKHEGTLTTIWMGYHFTDVETGESITGTFYGAGTDNQDKGLYKANTGGIKYILTSTFLIPTGDDPEDAGENRPSRSVATPSPAQPTDDPPFALERPTRAPAAKSQGLISVGQVKRLWAIAYNAGWKEEEILDYLLSQGFAEPALVHWKQYDAICSVLESGVDASR